MFKKHTQNSKSTLYIETECGVHIVIYVLIVPFVLFVPFKPVLAFRAVFQKKYQQFAVTEKLKSTKSTLGTQVQKKRMNSGENTRLCRYTAITTGCIANEHGVL